MDIQAIVDIVTGEAGALGILVILVFLLINGRIVSKEYVDDLKETNSVLIKTLQDQAESIEVISKTVVESLENSKTTLRILSEARNATGVKGEEVDWKDVESILQEGQSRKG